MATSFAGNRSLEVFQPTSELKQVLFQQLLLESINYDIYELLTYMLKILSTAFILIVTNKEATFRLTYKYEFEYEYDI